MKTNMITAGDVMTSRLITINCEQNLEDAITLLKKHKVDHLIVNDADQTVGIISKTDLYQRLLTLVEQTTGKTYSQMTLRSTKSVDVMTPKPICVEVSEPISNAIEILLIGSFHAVPVTEDDQIIGIITARDVMEQIIK